MPGRSNFRKEGLLGLTVWGLAQRDREGMITIAGADSRGIHSQEAKR